MSFEQYLKKNREKAYSFANANTKRDAEGHVVISKDDEWRRENEWDVLFYELQKRKLESYIQTI